MKNAAIGSLVLLAVCVAPGSVFAQGSGSTGPGFPGGAGAPLAVTRTINGIVAEIDPNLRLIAVTDEKGRRYEFRVTPETRFSADKNTELAGKKELDLVDFQPGWPVRFTFRPDDKSKVLADLRLRRVKP